MLVIVAALLTVIYVSMIGNSSRAPSTSRRTPSFVHSASLVASGKDLHTTRRDASGRIVTRIAVDSMELAPIRLGPFRVGPVREISLRGVELEIYKDSDDANDEADFGSTVAMAAGIPSIARVTVDRFVLHLHSRDGSTICRIESGAVTWGASRDHVDHLMLTDGVKVVAPDARTLKTSAASLDLSTLRLKSDNRYRILRAGSALDMIGLDARCDLRDTAS